MTDEYTREELVCDQYSDCIKEKQQGEETEVIVTYYNTKMDAVPTVDIMSVEWVLDHFDVVERVDCKHCGNIIFLDQ